MERPDEMRQRTTAELSAHFQARAPDVRGSTTKSPRTKWPEVSTAGVVQRQWGTAHDVEPQAGFSKPYFMEEVETEVGSGAWQSPKGEEGAAIPHGNTESSSGLASVAHQPAAALQSGHAASVAFGDSIETMEAFLGRALQFPSQSGRKGSQLHAFGMDANNLRVLGLDEEDIHTLYAGLSSQAAAFQHMLEQQMEDGVGKHAHARLQAMNGFKELHRRLIDVQENELRMLQKTADKFSEESGGAEGGRAGTKVDEVKQNILHAVDSSASPDVRAQLLQDALLEAKAAMEEIQVENQVLQIENEELRATADKHDAVVQKLRDDLRYRAGTAMDEAAALKAVNDAFKSEVEELKREGARRQRELETEKNKVRQAARDLAKSEERTQKLKEAQKAQEFSVKMMESQLKELSNDHVRRMDQQVVRFKKDMEEFTECQRRLRAVDADLVSMRALYLDETTSHAETKAAWEEAKKDWEDQRQVELEKTKELEVVAREKEALEGELQTERAAVATLEAKVKELVDELAAEEAARQEHKETRHKLNLVRCEAEQTRAQARVHIQELSADLAKVSADLGVAMDTMVRERNAKNEYRIKQDAMTNKIEAERHHIESLLDSLEETYRRAARAESEAEEAMRDYNGMQTRLKQAEDRNSSLRAALDELSREKSQYNSLLEMEKRRMLDKEADIRRLKKEMEHKIAQLEPLQEKAAAGDMAVMDLKRTQGEVTRVTAMKDRMYKELNDLNHKYIDSEAMNKQLKYQVEVDGRHVEALKSEVESLQEENRMLSEARNKMQVDLDSVQKKLTQRQMQNIFLQSQFNNLKGNHDKASEELAHRREHVGELQKLYDSVTEELAGARKGVITMEKEVAEAVHARDMMREEAKVYKSNMTTAFNGLETMLFAIEAERHELSDINARLHDNHKKATQRVEELLAAHPEAATKGRPVLQSLNEVSSEIGVVSRMIALETDALHKLKGHILNSEANTQQQLVEAHISANASTRVGSEAAKDLGDITYIQIAKGELDRQAAQMVAAEKDVAAAREAVNRERARREVALTDLENGLREAEKQRELLRDREEMWKEDIRAMEKEVQGAMTQVKMREQYCTNLAGKNKELEKKIADLNHELKVEREKVTEAMAIASAEGWDMGGSDGEESDAEEGSERKEEQDGVDMRRSDGEGREDGSEVQNEGGVDGIRNGSGAGLVEDQHHGDTPSSSATGLAAWGESEAGMLTASASAIVGGAQSSSTVASSQRTPPIPPSSPSETRRSTPREGSGSSPKARGRKWSRPVSRSCPACGWRAGGGDGGAFPRPMSVQSAQAPEAVPFAVRVTPRSAEDLAMLQHSNTQTDEVELWMRNHDSVQAAVYDRVKDKWAREMDIDKDEFQPLTVPRVLQNIRLCYEAKTMADAAALREGRRDVFLELSDVVFNLYLHRYGELEMATQHLVHFAASVRFHVARVPDIALFALSASILREKELPTDVIGRLHLTEGVSGAEALTEEGEKGSVSKLLLSPKRSATKPPARLSDSTLGELLTYPDKEKRDKHAQNEESEGAEKVEAVPIWTLLEEIGLGLVAEDPDAPICAHRAAWRSVATHMAAVPKRLIPNSRPAAQDMVHPVLPWTMTMTLTHPGLERLLQHADSFEYHRNLRGIDFGVAITPMQVPHIWYLLHQSCQLLHIPVVPELYIRPSSRPDVYFMEAAPLVRIPDSEGRDSDQHARVPWQRSPILIVTSAAVELLTPSELQFIMAGALGAYLTPGGGGFSAEEVGAAEGARLAALASIASLAELRPDLLKAHLPASIVLSWSSGLGATLSRVRDYMLLCSDRAALFVSQDIHLAASAILKMSSGCKVLSNTMNPDALLEEARQGEQAALQPMPRSMAMDLIGVHSSMAVLRVREADHFMSSPAYQSLLQGARPLAPTVTVPSSVRAPITPRQTKRLFELEEQSADNAGAALEAGLLAGKTKGLKKLHRAATDASTA